MDPLGDDMHFVGRGEELRQAEALADDAISGLPSVLVVDGTVGIGKTWFLDEVARATRERGMVTLNARCTGRATTPLRLFVDTLIPHLLSASETVPGLRELQPTLSDLHDGRDVAPTVAVPRLVEATLRVSEASPLALLVDDVQWAVADSLDFLDHLAFRLASDDHPGRSLLLVVAARSGLPQRGQVEPEGFLSSVSRHRLSRQITLRGLTESDLVTLARVHGLGSIQNRLGFRLVQFSGGNPLLAKLVVDELQQRDRGGAREFLTRDLAQLSLPTSVLAPFRALLLDLSPHCQTMVHGLSMIDFSPDVPLLTELLDADSSTVKVLVAEAMDAGIVGSTHQGVAFADPLLRHAARFLPRRDAPLALAAKWADLLVRRATSGDRAAADRLADYLVVQPASLEADRALSWLGGAATAASRRGEWARASELHDTMFSVLPDTTASLGEEDEAALYEAAGLAAQNAGDDDEAIRLLQTAAQGFDDIGDIARRAGAVNQLLRVANRSATTLNLYSREEISEVRRALGDRHPGIAAGLDVHLIEATLREADFIAAERIAEDLRDLDDAVPDETVILAELAMAQLALIRYDLGAMRHHNHCAHSRAVNAGDAQLSLNAAAQLAISLLFAGEFDEAESVAADMLRIGSDSGLMLARDFANAIRAGSRLMMGDLTTAEHLVDEAVSIEQRTERGNVAQLVYPLAVAVAVAGNDRPAALRALEAGEARIRSGDTNWLPTQISALRAWSYARLGESLVAQDHLASALEANLDRAIFFGVPEVAAAVIDAAHLCGTDASVALPAIERALDAGQLFSGTLSLYLPRIRAVALAGGGHVDEAIAALEDARRWSEAAGWVLESGRCCVDIVRLRLTDSLLADDERSVQLSRRVDDIVRRTGLLSLDVELRRVGAHRTLGSSGAAGQFRFVVFVDVVDSTRLIRELGDHAYLDRARRLRALLDAIVARHAGEVQAGVRLGDGVLATFTEVSDALEMATEARVRTRGAGLEVAIGIHAGDVLVNNQEAHGIAVNTAARFCDAAGTNQVSVSAFVRDAAIRLERFQFTEAGVREMKGLAEPQRLFLLTSSLDLATIRSDKESEQTCPRT